MGDPDSRAVLSGWLLSDVLESGTHRNRKSICRQTGGTLWLHTVAHTGTLWHTVCQAQSIYWKAIKAQNMLLRCVTFWAFAVSWYSEVFTLCYIMIQRNVSMHCKNWLVTACWVQIRTYSIFQLQQCSFSKYMVIYLKPDPPLAFSKTGRISETIFSVFLLLRQFLDKRIVTL